MVDSRKRLDESGLIAAFSFSDLGNSYPEEIKKKLADLVPSLGASWTFRTSLKNFDYSGEAKLGDADKKVFWYLPDEAIEYRVVYDGLTIGNAIEANLPKWTHQAALK